MSLRLRENEQHRLRKISTPKDNAMGKVDENTNPLLFLVALPLAIIARNLTQRHRPR